MENASQQVPPVGNQPPVKTPNNLSFAKALAYGFVIVSIGISIAVGGYLLGANKTKPQPISKTSVAPSLSPVPTIDPTANWKTYTSAKYNFLVKYPSNLEADDQKAAPPSVLFQPPQQSGAPGFPSLYVSVISDPPNQYDLAYNRFSKEDLVKLYATKVGETVLLGVVNPPYSDYWNFKRLPDLTINSTIGQMFENGKVWEGGKDLKDRRILIKKNSSIYIIGTYYTINEELNNFNLFLSTFKFIQ